MAKQESRNKYASSSFSGADIKVMVNLNVQTLNRVKRLIKEYQDRLHDAEVIRNANVNSVDGVPIAEVNRQQSQHLTDIQERLKGLESLFKLKAMELGTVQTISCQAHRPKAAVRAIGSTYARGYTRGPRTIAGSMIFTVINRQSLHDLCLGMSELWTEQGNDVLPSTILPDQLLPLDLTFLMANEYGAVSRMALYGVEFLNTGYTFSIEDLLLEEIVQFVARDMDPMNSIYDPQTHQESRADALKGKTATGRDTLIKFLKSRQDTLNRRKF
jgi:hypothetical protein